MSKKMAWMGLFVAICLSSPFPLSAMARCSKTGEPEKEQNCKYEGATNSAVRKQPLGVSPDVQHHRKSAAKKVLEGM